MFNPTVEEVLESLSHTPFSASKVDRLSGGSASFTYRITLREPYTAADSSDPPVRTVILKHAEPYAASNSSFALPAERQDFESLALRLVPPLVSSSLDVCLPRLYHEDREARHLFISDSGEASTTLKSLLQTAPPSEDISHTLGRSLGSFLARLHASTSTLSGSPLGNETKAAFASNRLGRTLSGFATYGRLIETLSPLPPTQAAAGGGLEAEHLVDPPLDVSAADLQRLAELAETMRSRIMSCEDVLTMGDFWSGNVLVSPASPSAEEEPRITVIDWELAKPGLAGLDLGQFLAECHLPRVFYPACRASVEVITASFLAAYREVFLKEGHGELALKEIARVAAVHFGVHLCVWTPRASWGTKKQIRPVVVEGIEYMLHAMEDDEEWLKTSVVGGLLR